MVWAPGPCCSSPLGLWEMLQCWRWSMSSKFWGLGPFLQGSVRALVLSWPFFSVLGSFVCGVTEQEMILLPAHLHFLCKQCVNINAHR